MSNFENKLRKNFPNLFPKDEKGNIKSPSCGIWCPEGWEDLVYKLCNNINYHVELNYEVVQKYKFYHKICTWFYKTFYRPIHNGLWEVFDPYKDFPKKDGETWRIIKPEMEKHAKEVRQFELKMQSILKKVNVWFYPKFRFYKKRHPSVTIVQIKQKFGGLRFYYSGGDQFISGLVSMAESMSYQISEISGEKGKTENINGYYQTLTPDEADQKKTKTVK